MTRLRVLFLLVLFLAPIAFLIGLGCYHLWATGMLWAWWPMLLCFALSYFLAWRWTQRPTLPRTDHRPGYWTDRDKVAWEKVTAKAKSYATITTEQIEDPKHYADVAITLATQVAE